MLDWRYLSKQDEDEFLVAIFFLTVLVAIGSVLIVYNVFFRNIGPTPTRPPHSAMVAKKMLPTIRLEQIILPPGEGVPVSIPTAAYLKKLEAVCENRKEKDAIKAECEWRIGQIREGRSDVASRVNPLYGRPPFTEKQLNYIRRGESRTKELLEMFESLFVSV